MFCFLATETVVQTKYHGAVKCGKQIRFQLLLGSGGWEGSRGGAGPVPLTASHTGSSSLEQGLEVADS